MLTSSTGLDQIVGTAGSFSSSSCPDLRAEYILAKARIIDDSSNESKLMSNLCPWREIFTSEVSFDELLQRDLNDSRVRHDLIPYLVEQSPFPKFFPPILAVAVPVYYDSSLQRTRLKRYYDEFTDVPQELLTAGTASGVSSGEHLAIHHTADRGSARLLYSSTSIRFVIVDGQHRAMAALALSRNLRGVWPNSQYKGFYEHIDFDREKVDDVNLPVCILYLPGLIESLRPSCTLDEACRSLFLTVNKTAKPVSATRKILLDDTDFCAHILRFVLSSLKDPDARSSDPRSVLRIYSVDYDDSDEDSSNDRVYEANHVTTAEILNRLVSIICFRKSDLYGLQPGTNLADARTYSDPNMPRQILEDCGISGIEHSRQIPRIGFKTISNAGEIANSLSRYAADILFSVFDGLSVFAAHNLAMYAIKSEIERVNSREFQECSNLLFESGSIRSSFETHLSIISEQSRTFGASGVPGNITAELDFLKAVKRRLVGAIEDVFSYKSCFFLGLRRDSFYPHGVLTPELAENQAAIKSICEPIFKQVVTQAFQLGIVASILTISELIILKTISIRSSFRISYSFRRRLNQYSSNLVIGIFNKFFAVGGSDSKTTLTAVSEAPHLRIFDKNSPGIRALYEAAKGELNEKSWDFFRYAFFEMAFSQHARGVLRDFHTTSAPFFQFLNETLDSQHLDLLAPGDVEQILQDLGAKIGSEAVRFRAGLRDSVIRKHLESVEVELQVSRIVAQTEAQARSEGLDDDEVAERIDTAIQDFKSRLEADKLLEINDMLFASLGRNMAS